MSLLTFIFFKSISLHAMPSQSNKAAPQCHDASAAAVVADDATDGEPRRACLESLSDDVLQQVLVCCGPGDVEGSLKLVSRRFQ